MNRLELENIHYAYPRILAERQVLRGVSLSAHASEVLALLGRNGTGKSTLLRITMGMLHPRQGTVRLFGQNPVERSVEVKSRIGYVSEDQILPPHLSVREVLDLHRSLFPTWDPQLEHSLCTRFGIERGPKVRNLSTGEARLVALICAVAHRPELLILDEPAGGLDPAARREFLEVTIQLLADEGSTIFLSSHYAHDVERIASRVALLHEGIISVDESLDRLREEYSLAIVSAELFEARFAHRIEDCIRSRERDGSTHMVIAVSPSEVEERLRAVLGSADFTCRHLDLEELFVELTARSE